MKKIIITILILLLLLYALMNLGTWLNVTKAPIRSDIVVCLGGGTVERVKKSIKLIEEGYTNKFLLLGESWYNQPYIKKNHPDLVVEIDESPNNTVEEIRFIKIYMKSHGYKSALIVTDPPHSRRVKLLIQAWANKSEIKVLLVSSDVKWWDDEHYWQNERARNAVLHESMKVVYTWISNLY